MEIEAMAATVPTDPTADLHRMGLKMASPSFQIILHNGQGKMHRTAANAQRNISACGSDCFQRGSMKKRQEHFFWPGIERLNRSGFPVMGVNPSTD
jgi:hypothetical protein|uniref:hypothetical protein n=1 Tax=Cephaloticoccus sp. TaxID=1985742 RepID=UPI0040499BB5